MSSEWLQNTQDRISSESNIQEGSVSSETCPEQMHCGLLAESDSEESKAGTPPSSSLKIQVKKKIQTQKCQGLEFPGGSVVRNPAVCGARGSNPGQEFRCWSNKPGAKYESTHSQSPQATTTEARKATPEPAQEAWSPVLSNREALRNEKPRAHNDVQPLQLEKAHAKTMKTVQAKINT